MPVGAGGVATTRDCGTPLPSYRVDLSLPLAATQTKPCGLKARPQTLTRLGSLGVAPPAVSETRLVMPKALMVVGGGEPAGGM
jgi:hypothetical protein